MTLYDKLIEVKDDNYKEFQAKLVPNIDKDIILGIRTPALRRIAKEVYESKDRDSFLCDLPHKYYEENLIHFFILSMIKDFNECINELNHFLPFVNNWATCDQCTPKVFKKNCEKYEVSHKRAS